MTRLPLHAATLLVILAVGTARAYAPPATVEGPIPGNPFLQSTAFDLGKVGYMREEFFVSGTAAAYTAPTPLSETGQWSASPSGVTAPYKTRIVVHRPVDAKKFNGTVLVEWLNVSGGLDAAPDWTFMHTELIRSGYAWVGVSAQFGGIEPGGGGLVLSLPLKTVDPVRYGSLSHPGDSFSYDLFSQAAQAVREPTGPRPLGDFKVKRMIAIGESQSAFRLVTYINAIHPLTQCFDGYFVHSRGAGGANLSQSPQPNITVPIQTPIRPDVDVPVLTFQAETDITFLGFAAVDQPDGKRTRLWEVAGTAHADAYTLVKGAVDEGASPAVFDLLVTSKPIPGVIECGAPINDGPQHVVLKAAISALNRWVRRGKAPKPAPRLEVNDGPPASIVTDGNGNALGGIRTPAVDVPIATFTGEQDGSILCRLFGTTTPFDAAKLASLYPTHDVYVKAYKKSLRKAVRSGYILKADAKLMQAWAEGSTIGN
jgi:hypothetical protein